jgi:fluoride exporter
VSGRRPPLLRGRWDVLAVIAAGGALGSLARWALGEAFPHGDGEVAWGTVLANLSGAFLLGVLMVFVLDVWRANRYVRPFLGVGVLGGYTTFSTYMLDTRDLLAAGEPAAAFGYLFGTLLAGLLAVWLGVAVARAGTAAAVRRRRRRPAPARDAHSEDVPDGPDRRPAPDRPSTRSPR